MDTLTIEHNSRIEQAEGLMLGLPQVEMPVKHHFSDGVYVREIFMPAGTVVIGHEHKTRHLNIISQGHARVMMDGETVDVRAPATFESNPGVRKVLYILEDMIWSTVHVTPEQSLKKLEEDLIVKSDTFAQRQSYLEALKKLEVNL